jgi:hypothetical protein
MHKGLYVIDGDAGTVLDNPEWTSEIEFMLAPQNARLAIIGAGPQLKMALRFAPRSVFAVDINLAIVQWGRIDDSDFNENISECYTSQTYELSGVTRVYGWKADLLSACLWMRSTYSK